MSGKILSAFTEDQAARLSKVSASQLAYWDRTDFFKPSLADDNRRLKFSRNYNFQDIVGLRTLSTLINEHGIPVRYLRKVREHLRRPQEVWANTTLYILGKRVYLQDPSSESFREPVSGQLTLKYLPLRKVVDDVVSDVLQLQTKRQRNHLEVETSKYVQRNAPVLSGTRVPVATVLAYLEDGYRPEDILAEFPTLTREDIAVVAKYLQPGAA